MANPELGAKQICPACQSKFYDLGRRPAVCPKCGESFDPEEAIKSRRVRARGAAPDYESDEAEDKPVKEVEGYEDEADETPEIDEAANEAPLESSDDDDSGEPGGGADDLGVDFAEDEENAESDDVPFLEGEDEDFADDDLEVPGGDEDEDR